MAKRVTKPSHSPTPEQRELVRDWAKVGIRQERIARKIGINDKTLRKHYREELDLGADDANAQVAGALYQKAINGDTSAQIFWAKTRMGWSEKTQQQFVGEDDQPINPPFMFVPVGSDKE